MNKPNCCLLLFIVLVVFRLPLSAQSYDEYYKSAMAKFDKNDFNGAIEDCNKLLSIVPNSRAALFIMANSKLQLKDSKGALSAVEILLREFPNLDNNYELRGRIYLAMGQYKQAISDFDYFITKRPGFADGYLGRGKAKTGLNDFKGAVADFDKAISLNPNLPEPVELKKSAIKKMTVTNSKSVGSIPLKAETVKDADGNVYKTITIGTQTWMTENLKVTRLNDGTPITQITDIKLWGTQQNQAFINNYYSKQYGYGNYYNWYTVNTQKLCPVGWHIPTAAEWTELTNQLGGENAAAGKLKGKSKLYPNIGNDTNQFALLPSGMIEKSGNAYASEYRGSYWSSSLCAGNRNASAQELDFFENTFKQQCSDVELGHTVRCIKGDTQQMPLVVNRTKVVTPLRLKQYDPDTYSPGTDQPFPEKWPYVLKDAAASITGFYVAYQITVDIKKINENGVALSGYISSWNGKIKDIGKGIDFEFSGYYEIKNIVYSTAYNHYCFRLGKGLEMYYYPDTGKFMLDVQTQNRHEQLEQRNKDIPRNKVIDELERQHKNK